MENVVITILSLYSYHPLSDFCAHFPNSIATSSGCLLLSLPANEILLTSSDPFLSRLYPVSFADPAYMYVQYVFISASLVQLGPIFCFIHSKNIPRRNPQRLVRWRRFRDNKSHFGFVHCPSLVLYVKHLPRQEKCKCWSFCNMFLLIVHPKKDSGIRMFTWCPTSMREWFFSATGPPRMGVDLIQYLLLNTSYDKLRHMHRYST